MTAAAGMAHFHLHRLYAQLGNAAEAEKHRQRYRGIARYARGQFVPKTVGGAQLYFWDYMDVTQRRRAEDVAHAALVTRFVLRNDGVNIRTHLKENSATSAAAKWRQELLRMIPACHEAGPVSSANRKNRIINLADALRARMGRDGQAPPVDAVLAYNRYSVAECR